MFDFIISPKDVAPVSPILFPVNSMRMERVFLLMDFICESFFFCVFTAKIECYECCV